MKKKPNQKQIREYLKMIKDTTEKALKLMDKDDATPTIDVIDALHKPGAIVIKNYLND